MKNHLLPNQLKECGLENVIDFESAALEELVKYSDEMGVRTLQRNIAKICRKMARNNLKQTVSVSKVTEILGPIRKEQAWKGVGVVNGMAWTEMGGKLMLVEAIKYPSEQFKIQTTGQLGEVMKQSVQIAVSWIKANRSGFSLCSQENEANLAEQIDELERTALHLHFPAGAIKKDGPSAGITIATCLVSLLSNIPVRSDLAMTGQISLSGRVLAVGGIREKCIAAIYEGVQHIIIPQGNVKDLEKIPADLKRNVKFYPVETIQQALGVAFPKVLDKISPKL